MFASLLPGIREIRAPLAAGYLWLALAYLVTGQPSDLGSELGPFANLAMRVAELGPLAVATATSFSAYLLGGVSVDVFGRLLRRLVASLADRLSAAGAGAGAGTAMLGRVRASARELGARPLDDRGSTIELDALRDAVALTRDALLETPRAGASESELPEGERAMLEAQEGLLVAIAPPVATISGYLAVTESPLWGLGAVAAGVLVVQAALRQASWRKLARQHGMAAELVVVAAQLADALRLLDQGRNADALQALNSMDLATLNLGPSDRRS